MLHIKGKFFVALKKLPALGGELFFCFFSFFMDFYHADSVCDAGESAEPDGNVIVVVNVVNRPHNKGDYDYPFEPHNVLGVDIPGEHACGDYRDPGYGVCGYGGYRENRLKGDKRDFNSGGTFPFGNDNVADNAYQRGDGAAVTSQKKMGKGVEPELKGLHNDVPVFVFDKTDEHHNCAADERNYITEKNVHLVFSRFSFFFNGPYTVTGGNNGESIECCGNEIEMVSVINEPHANGKDHYVFKFDNVFAVDYPGEKGSCKNRKPGYRVKGNGSEGKNNGKENEENFKRNGNFESEENKVSKNAYNSCNNAAHSSEKIVGNAHKGELNALGKKNFVFVFDKTDKDHHCAGDDGNYVCDDNYDVIIQADTSTENYKKTVRCFGRTV